MLTLHFHPLSSFCHKALIALYENDIAFEPVVVDLGDETSRNAFREVWPLLKFPVLVDRARQNTVVESTIIIEYLEDLAAAGSPMIPRDRDAAWQVRMWDRIFDGYLQAPMQGIVADALRPREARDPYGVAEEHSRLDRAYAFLEERLPERGWLVGGSFSLAECSATPALFWADTVQPIGPDRPKAQAYFGRLKARPSVARVLSEAEPFFHMFPLERKPRL